MMMKTKFVLGKQKKKFSFGSRLFFRFGRKLFVGVAELRGSVTRAAIDAGRPFSGAWPSAGCIKTGTRYYI